MKQNRLNRKETSDHIIAAAGSVFAERGFRGTTVRQITERAGVNLAAVNYYFRDKEELYIRVLREAKRCATQIVISDIPGNPEERLRGFIDRFVHYILDPGRPSWHSRILSMEMSNPTPALAVIVREVTAPLFRDVRALISEVAGGAASPEELDLWTVSTFSQCVFYASNRPIVEQLALHLGQTQNRTERIAQHIADLCAMGLRDFSRHRLNTPSRTGHPQTTASHVLQ